MVTSTTTTTTTTPSAEDTTTTTTTTTPLEGTTNTESKSTNGSAKKPKMKQRLKDKIHKAIDKPTKTILSMMGEPISDRFHRLSMMKRRSGSSTSHTISLNEIQHTTQLLDEMEDCCNRQRQVCDVDGNDNHTNDNGDKDGDKNNKEKDTINASASSYTLESVAKSHAFASFKKQHTKGNIRSQDMNYLILSMYNNTWDGNDDEDENEKDSMASMIQHEVVEEENEKNQDPSSSSNNVTTTNNNNNNNKHAKSKIQLKNKASKFNKSKRSIRKLTRLIVGAKIQLLGLATTPAQALYKLSKQLSYLTKPHPHVLEADGSGMKYICRKFENWGLTVSTQRKLPIFVPRTKIGLCNLVRWAKSRNLSVRVSGYRHSWSDITVNDGQILVSLLPPLQTDTLPVTQSPYLDPKHELQEITLLDEYEHEYEYEHEHEHEHEHVIKVDVDNDDDTTNNKDKKANKPKPKPKPKRRLCRIGAATTNEQFRHWVIENSLVDRQTSTWKPWWTLPLNVIMVEITFGGSNAPICHGAGKTTQTLSDLVTSMEFVNANGELQIVNDPQQLKSASGCFGMLGIVTSITMKLDPLTFANMTPKKKPLCLTIPPPLNFQVPKNIKMKNITQHKLDQAFQQFVNHCENDYYCEFFWFPGQDNCWINAWNNDASSKHGIEHPNKFQVQNEQTCSFLCDIMNDSVFQILPPSFQMNVMSTMAMTDLPHCEDDEQDNIVVPLIEALHFRRGIQNMRVSSMEFEIPIPPRKDDPTQPDYTVCQKAWWAVIQRFYERYNRNSNDLPMRLCLEMRITSDSDVFIAPQYGNTHGTCSVEILTPENVDREHWKTFMQETIDLWMNLKDDDGKNIHPFINEKGQTLHVRPHWAKEWMGMNVDGLPINVYLKEKAYKEQIPLFVNGLEAVCKDGGYTMDDANKIFSTKFSREMFF